MNTAQVSETVMDIIYIELFGKPYSDVLALAQSRPKWGMMLGILWNASDSHELLLDCLSIEALEAISNIQYAVTVKMLGFGKMEGRKLLQKIEPICRQACRNELKRQGIKAGDYLPLWYEDSEQN